MRTKIEKIVVLGGGSAGWMTASTLVNFFPEREIVVIESPDVPIVGVGESTLGTIRHWMYSLGIDEKDFMKYTNASYKMSIKFTDFYEKDAGSFHYPFGAPVLTDAPNGLQEWQAKRALYPDTPVEDYCRTYLSNMPLIESHKFSKNEHGLFDDYRPELHVAYHFDAVLFGQWLKESYSLPRGVKLITGTVTDVSTSDIGIDKLTLSDGSEVTADLFVDCTGWKSMLLAGALKEPFKSYADILPSNRAWACQVPYVDKEKELEPYTNCTAIGHGWCWNIPLWTRLGTGYVYSDNFISPEDAKEEFKQYLMSDKMAVPRTQEQVDSLEFRDIPMRVGIHERTWVKNVVAIGLSAGFIEPLESNGLYSVHEFLLSLVSVLQRTHITQWDRDVYNSQVGGTFNTFAEFVSLHYALSIRDDTNFWDDITSKTFCPGLVDMSIKNTSNTFFDLAWRKLAVFRHNEHGGLQYVATGMHFHIMSKLQLLYAERAFRQNPKKEVDEFVRKRAILQKKWQRAAELCPSLYQYLKDNVHDAE